MVPTKIVSFDMDGTLTDLSFVNSVWLEGIPRLLATKRGLSFDNARNLVKIEYDKTGRERMEWYDLNHWRRKFGLDVTPEDILSSYQHRIQVFPEVFEVLEKFRRKNQRMIILSNARRDFLNLELEMTGIEHYFEKVFSATSDFGLTKKAVDLYNRVCRICCISPWEMVHVGDDLQLDFDIPRKMGIRAYHIDRNFEVNGNLVIHSLNELVDKISDR